MRVDNKQNDDGSLSINIFISKEELSYLCHDLKGIDGVVEWFSQGPSQNKILKCKERMQKEWVPKLRDKGLSIPADDNALLDIILKDESYKDREARGLELTDA